MELLTQGTDSVSLLSQDTSGILTTFDPPDNLPVSATTAGPPVAGSIGLINNEGDNPVLFVVEPPQVQPFDLSDQLPSEPPIPVGAEPTSIAVANTLGLVTNSGDNTVTSMSFANLSLASAAHPTAFATDIQPVAVIFGPSGSTAFVVNEGGASTVTASTAGVSGSTPVTLSSQALVAIEVFPGQTTLLPGTTLQFSGRGILADGSSQDVTTT